MTDSARLKILVTASSELLGRMVLHTLAKQHPSSVIFLFVESGAEDCYIVDGNFGMGKTDNIPPSAPKINKIYADAGPFPADINAVVYCNSSSPPEQVAKFFDRCISQLPGLSIFVYASSIYVNWGAKGRHGGEDTSMAFELLPTAERPRASSMAARLIGSSRKRWPSKSIYLNYCSEQALTRRWLQNERSCRLAFVRLGLLTPPACSTLSRAFSAVAERVMVPEARALARARVGKSASDLMTISLLPTLDGRKTDPKAVILITPADLAARAVLSAAVEGVRGSAEITESPQVYALALASPMLQWDKLRCLIIDHSGGRVSAADGRGTGAVLRRAPPPHEVCSATLERIDPEVCADVRGLHIHNYLTHCLGLIENGGAEFLDVRPPTGRSLTMQQPLRYTDVLSDAKWQHGGVLNFALRKEALSYYMPSMERVRSLVMNSRAVREATHSKKLKGEAEAMLDRIMGNQRSDVLRGFVIVLHRVFTSIYDRVLVNHDGLGKLKELNQRGAKILLLPTHRSYIDFLVLSYICYYADIRLPFIATGDNFFSIAGIWKILQHSGAFFMKRSFNSETHPLYSIVFKTYMQVILEEQGCVEMFIEGARSRSGTMIRPPKVGLLRFATEPAVQTAMNASSASDFTDEDEVFLVPISIGYSRVMEVDSLATELEGRAKVAESLARTVSALRYLSMNFGTLTVHIDPEPIKVSDVVKRWMSEQKGDYSASHVPPKSPRYATPYQQLAEEVADRLDANMPIHTTHLVAAILLWKRHDSSSAVSHALMVDKVRWLSSLLRRRGLTVILDDNNTSSAVSRVASLYVDHVVISAPEEETGEVKYSVCPANPLFATLLLSYYRNQLIYHLGHEACLVLAAGDLTKLSFLRTELLLECIPAQQQRVPEGCDRELNDFAVSLIGPVVECWWVVALAACTYPSLTTTPAELVSRASGLAKEMYEEGRCSYLEACSFDFAKKAVRGMEKRGCITVKGRTVHITVEKMHELLALLESIKESPALPQGKALSNSSEVSCGGVEERQQPAQRGLFTQLRDMTLVKPLGRLNGTSRM
ncbi:hypothetical protein FOZ60_007368 [Perkinsus olseni]|uniref:Phospholipid/glycerol acyltransferase domain-containing protein n=2 Tax=Perkinsus olseni TaxID=32597 RepID=A0A7J6NMP5_PEROL|nr:hypothetical protein FOZ60_007368 [Perkinsus olseni]